MFFPFHQSFGEISVAFASHSHTFTLLFNAFRSKSRSDLTKTLANLFYPKIKADLTLTNHCLVFDSLNRLMNLTI